MKTITKFLSVLAFSSVSFVALASTLPCDQPGVSNKVIFKPNSAMCDGGQYGYRVAQNVKLVNPSEWVVLGSNSKICVAHSSGQCLVETIK